MNVMLSINQELPLVSSQTTVSWLTKFKLEFDVVDKQLYLKANQSILVSLQDVFVFLRIYNMHQSKALCVVSDGASHILKFMW